MKVYLSNLHMKLAILLLLLFAVPASAWQGRVFEVKGANIVIATPIGSQTRQGTTLYVIDKGKEVGSGRVTVHFHSKIEMRLAAGRAAKGMLVTDRKPDSVEKEKAGFSWTKHPGPGDNHWSAIAYGNGVFVAIAPGHFYPSRKAAVAVSSDGINWTIGKMPSDADWRAVAFGNGIFVAIASNNPGFFGAMFTGSNQAAISADGITWHEQELSNREYWTSLAFENGLFLAAGLQGETTISSNGVEWRKGTTIPMGLIHSVTSANGVFVSVANCDNRPNDECVERLATSADGINWVITPLPSGGKWNSVAFGKGILVVTARHFQDYNSQVIASSDGLQWLPGKLPFGHLSCPVVFGIGTFVAISDSNDMIATSTDGIQWTEQPILPIIGGISAFGGDRFIILGLNGVVTTAKD